MTDDLSSPEAGSGAPPGVPRWVKMFGIVFGVLVLIFIVLRLTGFGGNHGPGRHGSASGTAAEATETTLEVTRSALIAMFG